MPKIMLNDKEYSGGSSANIDITNVIDENSTDTQAVSAKAVYDELQNIENGTTTVANAKTVGGLTAKEIGVSGVRNLIPYPYYSSTYESGGITFTDNGDGTITVNGTNSSGSALWFNCRIRTESSPWSVANGTYVLSGCPKGGSISTFRIHFGREVDGTFLTYCTDFGDSAVVDVSDNAEKMQIQIGIAVGATVDNLTFKPMLEIGSIAHDYVPYNYGNCETLCGKTVSDFAPSTHFITDPNDPSYSAMQTVVDENIYRLQIQNNGEAHFYNSADNGVNWDDKGVVIHSGNVKEQIIDDASTTAEDRTWSAKAISDSLGGVKFIQKTYSGVESSVTLDCFPSDRLYWILGNVGYTNLKEHTSFEIAGHGTRVERIDFLGATSNYLDISIVDESIVVKLVDASNADIHVQAICIPYFNY